MSALLQDSPPMLEAYKEFQHFSSDKAAQDWLRWRERFLEEQRMDFAEALEGGLEKGRAEGEAKKALETARVMKSKGLDNALIVEITGLSLSEIERLD